MSEPALRVDDASALAAYGVGPLGLGDVPAEDEVPSLPGGHPIWQRDALAVSSRVRALLATLRPIAVRVLTFWDHAVRTIRIGGRTVEVDPSGCYRLR
jgi:hypothetical protein